MDLSCSKSMAEWAVHLGWSMRNWWEGGRGCRAEEMGEAGEQKRDQSRRNERLKGVGKKSKIAKNESIGNSRQGDVGTKVGK